MKSEKLYLIHIVEANQRLQDYVASGKDGFLHDNRTQDAIIKVLGNIAESVGHLSDEVKNQYGISWKTIKGFRNILIHDYLGDLDLDIVWRVIEESLPKLVETAQKILKEKYNIEL